MLAMSHAAPACPAPARWSTACTTATWKKATECLSVVPQNRKTRQSESQTSLWRSTATCKSRSPMSEQKGQRMCGHDAPRPAPPVCVPPRELLPASRARVCSSLTTSSSASGTRKYFIYPPRRVNGQIASLAERLGGKHQRTVLPRM